MCFGDTTPKQQFNSGIASQVIGGISSYNQNVQYGEQQGKYYDYLATQEEHQAVSEMQQGQHQATNYGRNAQQFRGSQLAAMAANGVSGESASAQNVLSDTAMKQKLDEDTIMYNANLKAYQSNNQAELFRYGADNARAAGKAKAIGSLVGMAGSVNNTWNMWKKTSQGVNPPG